MRFQDNFRAQTPAHQPSLGQSTALAVAEHTSRQSQGHRMYFLPGGGSLIGWEEGNIREGVLGMEKGSSRIGFKKNENC